MVEKAPFLDTGAVARLLRMHPNTLRDNLVPIGEWVRGSSAIPSLRLGGRHMIPRWWVEEVIKLGSAAPVSQNTEDATEVQKTTKWG